jgi:hypothetical protein
MSSSSNETDTTTPRRQFIGELAAGAAALAAVACAPAATASNAPSQAPTPVPASSTPPATPMAPLTPQSQMKWETSWMDKITGKHKVVFDSPEINDGTALYHALSYLSSVKDVYGHTDADASVVCVLRHAAVPMLYNDAMWEKYDLGVETKTNDQQTKLPVKRNVYFQRVDKDGKPMAEERPSATIKSLSGRGVIFVGCDLATRGFSYRLAQKTKQQQKDVYEEIRQNLVPGAILMTTGIFGMLMAQEAGCAFMKST